MRRRRGPYTHRVQCAETGCKEVALFEYDRRADYQQTERSGRGWRCVRHTRPDEVLSLTNRYREKIMTAQSVEGLPSLFFNGSNGFMSGPGFRAFANDFPEGTRIRITAEVIGSGTVERDAERADATRRSAAQ